MKNVAQMFTPAWHQLWISAIYLSRYKAKSVLNAVLLHSYSLFERNSLEAGSFLTLVLIRYLDCFWFHIYIPCFSPTSFFYHLIKKANLSNGKCLHTSSRTWSLIAKNWLKLAKHDWFKSSEQRISKHNLESDQIQLWVFGSFSYW